MKGSEEGKALKSVIATTPGIAKVYLGELVVSWESAGMPAALVYRVGGDGDEVDRRPRWRVDVFAQGLTAVEDAMEAIRDRLVYDGFGCSWHATDYGVIDDVSLDGEPMSVPYPDSLIRQLSANFRVTRRDY